MTDNFIGVYEGFCSKDYCDRMIEAYEDLDGVCASYKGELNNNGTGNRKDLAILFRKDAPELAVETNKLLDQALMLYLDEHPSLAAIAFYSNDVKVQRTKPKGGFHQWHSEQGADPSSATRCLTWMIYLNDTPEGEGETEFLEFGVKLQPTAGTVVFFPAAWTHTHRGNPMYTANKYIATGWYYLG